MRILIAEDDAGIAAAVGYALGTLNSFAVDCVADGEAADHATRHEAFDLLVLDLGLPKIDGFEVIRRLRARGNPMPVLIMSGRSSPEDKVRGLDLGADDYVVKPFSVKEFEARVRALLRRGRTGLASGLSRAGVCFDSQSRTATLDGKPLPLSAREAAVLELLLRDFGRVVRKEKLIEHLYCYEDTPGLNAIEVFVHRLRKKLSVSPLTVKTHHGIGYQLDHRDAH